MYSSSKPQLFLLHFAGGSCYSFDFLKNYISDDIDFIPLEIPGRGKRIHEDLLNSKQDAIEDYVLQILKLRNSQPYVIYGHSMGATLGLSVAHKMQLKNNAPKALIVSGNAGPGAEKLEPKRLPKNRYMMSDSDLKKELRKLGGVPHELLTNEDAFEFFSAIIRADFEILEKGGVREDHILLQLPIYALMGAAEEDSSRIKFWQKFTSYRLTDKIYEGGHFFIHQHPEAIAETVSAACLELAI
jgi:surfactin synthase thioesterase subunit